MRTSHIDLIAYLQRAIAESGIDMKEPAKHEPGGLSIGEVSIMHHGGGRNGQEKTALQSPKLDTSQSQVAAEASISRSGRVPA